MFKRRKLSSKRQIKHFRWKLTWVIIAYTAFVINLVNNFRDTDRAEDFVASVIGLLPLLMAALFFGAWVGGVSGFIVSASHSIALVISGLPLPDYTRMVFSALAAILLGAVIGYLRDQRETIKEAEEKLEERVAEQTRALSALVKKLEAEIIERKRIEETLRQSERDLRNSNRELRDIQLNLEERVAARTRELEAVQEKLIRQEKLAFLGQLAGGVAHELRNPLGVITNAVYFLNLVLTDTDETTQEYLDLIANRVEEAEKIVSALLSLSHNRVADRAEVAASQLLDEVLTRHPAPEAVVVTINLPPDLPPLFIDGQQIGQVLTNLVTNAYQAMPNGGKLILSAQAEGEGANLVVSDSGHGMSPETMGKIFEPLFTTKAKGIGLGLAVSKKLVELNGGKIKVESTEGQGSTFIITLPVVKNVLGQAE